MGLLYWKHLLVRTPLEGPAKKLQHLLGLPKRLRHPELRELHLEDDRMHETMRRLIKSDSNCIDIGCHIGATLSLILKLAPPGKHFAFEPVPQKAAWLQKKFPEVTVKQMALSEQSGPLTFTENITRPGFSGFISTTEPADHTRQITVDCDRLDNVIPSDHRVDFIKIDVEGAELLVLRGAMQTIGRCHPAIVFESGPGGAKKFGFTREQLFSFLTTDLGYSIYFFKDFLSGSSPLALATFEDASRYPFKAFNYVAIKAPV
jgi:FkbM family methyltransferase